MKKWFSIKGIKEEMSKVFWPKPGELAKNTTIAIVFTTLFALFFILCDLAAAEFFRVVGM